MMTKGRHTIAEITSQPAVWTEVIESFYARQDQMLSEYNNLSPRNVLFTGCGSTHYLSQVAAALFQGLTGIPAKAVPSSELLLFPEQNITDVERTLLVAISRSGSTTETVQAVSRFRKLGGLAVWVIGCYPRSELVKSGDLSLVAEAANEHSVAQTRSFSSMLILVQALAATVAGRDISLLAALPGQLANLLNRSGDLFEALGKRLDIKRFFFLGSGYLYGIANEAMLKMKEMSLSNSEAFHFLEFRHGPMSMANDEALIVGLLSGTARDHEDRVLREMAALGAHTLGLNASPASDHKHGVVLENTGSDQPVPEWVLPALLLPPLQLLAYHRAISKGLDPDNPRNLEAVVSLDSAAFLTPERR
jgi:glucosamine--fructose-6-phosphate aminotransferase (isomerizing)